MDSLLFLCARRVVAQHPLPSVHDDVYPILFQAAFLDGRPLALRDLVASWPFPELHLQRLLGHRELDLSHDYEPCIEAIIQGVMEQLQRELEEPSCNSSLRMLDMTGPSDSMAGCNIFELTVCSSTNALAKACVELSEHQEEFQRHRSKRHKGCSGAATATPQPPGVDVHTDLSVSETSYEILRDALHTGAAGPLRLKCREFTALHIVTSEIMTLLESLDPSCLRRVELCYNSLELNGLLVILPRLSRFPELCSLKVRCNDIDMTWESTIRIQSVARQLGMLPSLRELNLEFSDLSGNLRRVLCNLQAPLESLELPSCSLVPADFAFLSQSFHAPALKRLDLSSHDISQGLLEPLQLLLEKASASLLQLDLSDCHIADSHLAVLLPTLLRCSRLRVLGLYDNPLSRAAIKDLLQKTLELPDLHLVVYPDPKACYKPGPPDSGSDFLRDKELFAAAEAEFSQILVNTGRTDLVWTDDSKSLECLDYFSL